MRVTQSSISPTRIKLSIEAEPSELEPIKRKVIRRLSGKVKIAGFRDGKAPLELVEKNLDQAVLQTEFLEEIIQTLYVNAAESRHIRPVDRPDIQLTKFVPFTTVTFDAEVEVIGKITLPDYTKLRKTKPTVTVSAKDVTDVLRSLQTQAADKKDVDRAAKLGDQVWIDFKGVDADGAPVSGADGENYPLLLGSKTFIPGFEDNVIGLKPGEAKTFTVTFPADYGTKALANKDVTFTNTVSKVQHVVEPALDDAFAAKASPFKTLTELKADIKHQLAQEKQREADRQFEEELVREITSRSTVDVPDVLIEEQITRAEDEERRNLVYRGQTWEEHLKDEGVTPEEHREQKRPAAIERVKAGLVLTEISETEKLTVTPEELEIRIQVLKGQYQDPQMQTELDKPENRRDVASRILTEKTLAKLVAYVTSKQ